MLKSDFTSLVQGTGIVLVGFKAFAENRHEQGASYHVCL